MKKVYILITILICLASFLAVHADDREDYLAGPENCYNTGCGGLGGQGKGTHTVEVVDTDGNLVSITVPDEYSAYVVDEIQGDGFKACDLLPRVGEGGCPGMSPPHTYEEKFKGKCGCPTTPQYKIDGCQITVSCDLQDDDKTLVKVDIPCPTVAGTDPKYPLVKMLSGTLVEWRVNNKDVESPHVIKYTNHKERPWTTYDKFVEAMCKFSKSRNNCAKALKGVHHQNFRGNFYLCFAIGSECFARRGSKGSLPVHIPSRA